MITPKGIHTIDPDDNTEKLHLGDSATDSHYGAVFGVLSHSNDQEGMLDAAMLPSVIKWTGVSLKKDHTLKIYINNVKIMDRPDDYPWMTQIGPSGGLP